MDVALALRPPKERKPLQLWASLRSIESGRQRRCRGADLGRPSQAIPLQPRPMPKTGALVLGRGLISTQPNAD